MKRPDDFSTGVALCCAGSIILVLVLYLGLWGLTDDVLALISISIVLHVMGLVLVMAGLLIRRWRTEAARYYDWGLEPLT